MMINQYRRVFGDRKIAIAMVHFGALPGSPLYDADAGLAGLIDGVERDLDALVKAGFDAVMFGNENDRPYEFNVDVASTATMAAIIGAVKGKIGVPFGVNVLWDPMSTVALAAATGASFVREIFTGTYASDMGPWTPDAGKAMRYRNRLGRSDLAMLYNISAEFAHSLDQRPLPDRARSAVFSSVPDAVLVSGQITGEAAKMSDLEAVKKVLPDTPVLANTGVKHATVKDVFAVSDGCIVGSSLKIDG
ncbi:MAG: BtpA/SgcQ family protein, partial [Rhizobiaceae bacterium]